mgnify:CR=1 FL=1
MDFCPVTRFYALWPDAITICFFLWRVFFFIWEKPLHCKGKLSINNSFEVCKPVDKKEAAICVVFITELWYSFLNLFSLRLHILFFLPAFVFFWSRRISLLPQKFPLPLPYANPLVSFACSGLSSRICQWT